MWSLLVMTFISHLRTSNVLQLASMKMHSITLGDYFYTQIRFIWGCWTIHFDPNLFLSLIIRHIFPCGGCELVWCHSFSHRNKIKMFCLNYSSFSSFSQLVKKIHHSHYECWVKVIWMTGRLITSVFFPLFVLFMAIDLVPLSFIIYTNNLKAPWGHFIMLFCTLGHRTRHFIMFYLPQAHPRGHFPCVGGTTRTPVNSRFKNSDTWISKDFKGGLIFYLVIYAQQFKAT